MFTVLLQSILTPNTFADLGPHPCRIVGLFGGNLLPSLL